VASGAGFVARVARTNCGQAWSGSAVCLLDSLCVKMKG